MPYKASWFVDKRVMLLQAWGERTLEEMQENSDIMIKAVREGHPPVHIFADIRQVTEYPRSLKEIKRSLSAFQEPNLGWIVVVTENQLISFLGDVVSQLSQKNFKSFKTPDEAIAFLWRIDASLPETLPTYNDIAQY